MSCHLLLNLLHSLAKMILCSAEPRIISCLPTHVINLVINDNSLDILYICVSVYPQKQRIKMIQLDTNI